MKLIILLLASNLFAIEPTAIYNIASHYTSKPATIVAISCVESQFGKYKGLHAAKGVCQLQPDTVRFIATKDSRLRWVNRCTDNQLSYVLQHNDYLNVMISSIAFKYRLERYGYKSAVMRHYKKGNLDYLRKVKESL